MSRHTHRPMNFESLEDRKLMTASIDFNAGVLEIEGTNGDDVIIAEETTQTGFTPYWYNYRTRQGGGGNYTYDAITVTIRDRNTGALRAQESIDADYVNRIFVEALGGNDQVLNNTSIDAEIYGGDGYDDLTGGSGDDVLYGGDGYDTIRGIAGDDQLFGDGGGDELWGGSGRDSIVGGAGRDDMNGGSGDDWLDGRGGGSSDYDFIFGHTGRDVLIGSGQDWLMGGADQDVYYYQAWDLIDDDAVAGYGWQISPDTTFSRGSLAGYSMVDEANAPAIRSGF